MKPLRRLLLAFAKYRLRAALALLAMVVVSVSTVAMLFLLAKVIDDTLGPGASGRLMGQGTGPAAGARGTLLKMLEGIYGTARAAAEARGVPIRLAVPLLMLLSLISKNVFSYLSEFELNGIGVAMVRDLRRQAYEKLLRQSTSFYTRTPSGDLMSRMLSDVEQIQTAFGHQLADLVQGFLTLILLLVYVFSINARLATVVFLLTPVILLPIATNTRRLGRAASLARQRIGELGNILSETIRGNRVIKTYAMEGFEARRFEEANQDYFRVNRRTVRIQARNAPFMEILGGIALSALFVYAASEIHAGRMQIGELFSFLFALMMMYKPLKDVTRINMAVQIALSSAARVFELVDSQSEIVEKPGARDLAPFSDAIRYEGVRFGYGGETVLQGIDVTIRRGETVALVGPSGGGKTTLANLLPRLYDPTAGRITFDGVDLRDATLASLRGQVSLVTQDTILFDSSARSNIAYGQSAPAQERVETAARAAYAHEFIEKLPEGYDTRVGENAARLSGGQKQRLAIARAIYKDAPILVLDEATSQLDTESEALVARALANLMRGRTTLVIAHRLSTVRRADRILVMDAGRIVESGTHQELLTRHGLYRRLHEMQYFLEPAAAGSEPLPAASATRTNG
ncbi:MAG TPA: ABC transporter ATP-binding protein [Thermoanaerobaculia bacterium]|nr:ABC transporter ATP-binding protein [Thermoanaerobaculia bacterium]